MRKLVFTLILFFSSTLLYHHTAISQSTTSPWFDLLDPRDTKVDFKNKLIADMATKENLFDYDFFYNGAGVGIADLNNDELPDLVFTGNQVPNRIYLNEGDLRFQDITEAANINQGKQWSNGVTFVDINQDGWLDIYICQGGPFQDSLRHNLLFINQQNGKFEEQAEEYGLNDQGISTQAVFFDYDKDGDLDCIVSNENELYGIGPVQFYKALYADKELLTKNSSHLYRNDGGQFVRVTEEAGLLRPSFGLGITVSDINDDGWLDIYQANDYYVPDALFINKGDGTFRDEIKNRTNQVSFYGMGVDIADLNNDGHQDMFILDMASSDHVRSKTLMASMNVSNFRMLVDGLQMPHQYMFNTLQANKGDGHFHNIAHLSKVAKTDWSWAGLMADFDNDGLKDILVTNGYRRYALDNDLKARVTKAQIEYKGKVPLDVKKELYYSMPTEKLANILYHNEGEWKFKNVADQIGLEQATFSNGAAFADLDQDGDLDIVINNIDEFAHIYENKTSDQKIHNFVRVKLEAKQSEGFAKVTLKYPGGQQLVESKRVRGYLSSVEDIAHFGIGKLKKVNSLEIEWPDGQKQIINKVKVNRQTTVEQSDAKPATTSNPTEIDPLLIPMSIGQLKLFYKHREDNFDDFAKEVLLPYKQSSFGPCLVEGDVNGDGRTDLFIGGASRQASALFIQNEKGFEKQIPAIFQQDSIFEDLGATFLDYDGDGDQDLLVLSGGNSFGAYGSYYRNRLYRNDAGNWVDRSEDLNLRKPYSSKVARAFDFDKDGDQDLIIGNRIEPQAYPKAAPSFLLENKNGVFEEVSADLFPDLSKVGIINQIVVTDYDQDSWEDILIVGEWTGVHLYKNQKGHFVEASTSEMKTKKGWWFNATEADLNNDGRPDYILGNLGLNSKYTASEEQPFKVYANDFDESGSLDIVLSKEYKGEEVPVRGRECSSQQMPFIKEKFPTFKSFAEASIDDIYGDKLETSINLEVTDFQSYVLINQGDGAFEFKVLPRVAQFFPMLNIVARDLNQDGFDDLILSGTIMDTEVETPRWDAGSGLILLNDQAANFSPIANQVRHLNIQGDVKSMQLVPHQGLGKDILIIGRNNAVPVLYQCKD